jgi:hypothetical protein
LDPFVVVDFFEGDDLPGIVMFLHK